MSTLQKIGGISSLICAATYLVSMGLLFTLLTPFSGPRHRFCPVYGFFLDQPDDHIHLASAHVSG